MFRYKYHKKGYYGYFNVPLKDENVTFLSFDQWVVLYNADKTNWQDLINSYYTSWGYEKQYHLPVYIISNHKFRYIKFLTAKDYRKYLKFINKITQQGEDSTNLQEILELTEIIKDRIEKAAKQAKLEAAIAQDNYEKQLIKVTQAMRKEENDLELPHK